MVMPNLERVEAYVNKVWREEHRACEERGIAEALVMSELAVLNALLTLEERGRLKAVE